MPFSSLFLVRIVFQTQWPDGRHLQLRQITLWPRRKTAL